MNFFTNLFTQVDLQVAAFLNANVALAAAYAAPFISAFAIITIVTLGVLMIFGKVQNPAPDIVKAMATVAVITAFATNLGVYNLFDSRLDYQQ